MIFQLYILLHADMPYTYPYVGISKNDSKVLQVHEEHINILKAEDSTFFETDYLPTSRSVEFDLQELDKLIENYTGQKEYRIIVRFNEEKHVTITYHSPNNEAPKDYDIFLGYPSQRAEKLIGELYPLLEQLKKDVLKVDD